LTGHSHVRRCIRHGGFRVKTACAGHFSGDNRTRADKLVNHGRIPRGYLGLGLHPVPLAGKEGMGAMVMSVDPKGPGAAAGVHQGDVIVAFSPIDSVDAAS
jgi:S1-C subfamily serine protease